MLGEKRRFQETMGEEAASASNAAKRLAPSGSLGSREPYTGSRKATQRYEYSIKSKAAFVELHQDWYPPPNEGPQLFKELLENVQGVDRVMWKKQDLAGERGQSLLRAKSARVQQHARAGICPQTHGVRVDSPSA